MSSAHIHPMIVHFPIVFALTLAAFDLVATARGHALFGRGGVAQVSVGLAVLAGLTALAAIVFGGVAEEAAVAAGRPEAIIETHAQLGTATGLLLLLFTFARGYLWWRDRPGARGAHWTFAGLEVVAAALIIVTAYFGGQLVYEHGINVMQASS